MSQENEPNAEELKELRKKLRDLEKLQKVDYKATEQLEYFFDISLDLLCIATVDGYFKRVNKAFTQLLGFSEEELLAVPFFELIHPDDLDATLEEVKKLESGIDTIYFENRYRTKKGVWKWLAWTCPATHVGVGLLYGVARDITWQKELEAERENLIEDLQDALAKIKTLRGLLPICASCKKVRDDKGYWNQVEVYIRDNTDVKLTHGYCPSCAKAERKKMDPKKGR